MSMLAMCQSLKERDHVIELARMAELAERFEDMIEFMVTLAKMGTELNTDEKNMLSIAFKKVIAEKRSSWRVISDHVHNSDSDSIMAVIAGEYIQKVEVEIREVCQKIIDLLDNYLFPMAQYDDKNIFYYKLKGDYYRYLAEIKVDVEDQERIEIQQKANDAYQQALTLSILHMDVADPVRLGIALNYSVFNYEILGLEDKACRLARTAFESAIDKLNDIIDDSDYKESSIIMELLRDNLTLWAPDVKDHKYPMVRDDSDSHDSPRYHQPPVISYSDHKKNGSMPKADNPLQ